MVRYAPDVRIALFLGMLEMGVASQRISSMLPPYGLRVHWFTLGPRSRGVTVAGSVGADLDCWLFDQQGALVSSSTDASHQCLLPVRKGGRFRLVIENMSGMRTAYRVRPGLPAAVESPP